MLTKNNTFDQSADSAPCNAENPNLENLNLENLNAEFSISRYSESITPEQKISGESTLPSPEHLAELIAWVRQTKPLVHTMTNFVAMHSSANALLAIGASPVMAHAIEEVKEIAQKAHAVVLNLGTLSSSWVESMLLAGQTNDIVVLDPVGVGATSFRHQTARRILETCHPSIIRGKASETRALAGSQGYTRGVDSQDSSVSAVTEAQKLAQKYKAIVVVSGVVDYIVSAQQVAEVHGGHELLTSITAMGSNSSALMGAFTSLSKTKGIPLFSAAISCMVLMKLASQQAYLKTQEPGTFEIKFVDALYSISSQPQAYLSGLSPMVSKRSSSAPSRKPLPAQKHSFPTVLTIPGSDSGGGPGIQADIKSISANGAYAASVITAVTAQNTQEVRGIYPMSQEAIAHQMATVLEDIPIDVVKIGMLHDSATILTVKEMLQKYKVKTIVLDPVMVSTSGHKLLEDSAIETLKNELIPMATLITPNIPEAEILLGRSIKHQEDLPGVAKELSKKYGSLAVLVKAGHLHGDQLTDILYEAKEDEILALTNSRIDTPNTHGTGCTLSSAIAAQLAKGHAMRQAVKNGVKYVSEGIAAGQFYFVGHGHGSVHHFYALEQNTTPLVSHPVYICKLEGTVPSGNFKKPL